MKTGEVVATGSAGGRGDAKGVGQELLDGDAVIERHRAIEVWQREKDRQDKGGHGAGAIARDKSNKGYGTYRTMFATELAAELAKGATLRQALKTAKREVDKKMTKDNFKDPFTGEHPSDRTLRKHYYPK